MQVRPVERVVDDGGAGLQVDAVEGAALGIQVRRREREGLAREDVSNVRHTARAYKPRGRVDSRSCSSKEFARHNRQEYTATVARIPLTILRCGAG